jgi:hypothetical protein
MGALPEEEKFTAKTACPYFESCRFSPFLLLFLSQTHLSISPSRSSFFLRRRRSTPAGLSPAPALLIDPAVGLRQQPDLCEECFQVFFFF